jgi:hypothetical protein
MFDYNEILSGDRWRLLQSVVNPGPRVRDLPSLTQVTIPATASRSIVLFAYLVRALKLAENPI